jgi:pimeloyl-ACP methyl ester carboxylesterase
MELGYEEAGQGPVLVLVHGFPVDHNIWRDQLAGLADVRRVMAIDLRGRGNSPASATDGWTIHDYADDIAETIDSRGISEVDLAGLSMGGYVAFSLLRNHADKVRSLVLMSTKAEEDTPEARKGRDENASLVKEKGSEALVEAMFDKLVSKKATEEIKEKVRAMFLSIPPETAIADLVAMRDRPDFTQDLGSIRVPTLVVQGTDDDLLKVEAGRAMASSIPQGRFVSIPDAAHFVCIEQPSLVNQALRDFLEGVTRA